MCEQCTGAIATSALLTATAHAHEPHIIGYSTKPTCQERSRSYAGSKVVARTVLKSRPAPTTAVPASEAIIDRAPLKNDELGKGGSGHLGPDTPVPKTAADAAAACTSDLLMVTTLCVLQL